MGHIITITIFLVWFPQAVSQLMIWLYWIQIKEYRFDRFRTIFSSSSRKKDLCLEVIALKLVLIVASIANNSFIWLFVGVLLSLDLYAAFKLFEHKQKKPLFTKRVKNILGALGGFMAITWFLAIKDTFYLTYGLLILELALIIGLAIGVYWTGLIAKKVKSEEVLKAKEKLEKVKPLVVGVTGSYGKTTTKDFIYQLLSSKYKTGKTLGSQNTEFGLARSIISNLHKGDRYFIAEYGAYKKGEIRKLTSIAKPDVAVITGIEPQHLELYGNIENIKSTKYELIEGLGKGGTVVFNVGNANVVDLFQKTKKERPDLKLINYALLKNGSQKVKADYTGKIIKANKEGVDFEVDAEGKLLKFYATVYGIHFVENLLAAIVVARLYKVSWKQIQDGLKSIVLPEKTMSVKKTKNGTVIIDDSRNSAPKGFEAALDYLLFHKDKKKVVITPGIIELGKLSGALHRKLGKKIAASKIDRLVLTNKDFESDVKKGLGSDLNILKVVGSPNDLMLLDLLSNKNAILIEGRVPGYVHQVFK